MHRRLLAAVTAAFMVVPLTLVAQVAQAAPVPVPGHPSAPRSGDLGQVVQQFTVEVPPHSMPPVTSVPVPSPPAAGGAGAGAEGSGGVLPRTGLGGPMLSLVLLGLVLVLVGSTLVAGQRRMGSLRNVPS